MPTALTYLYTSRSNIEDVLSSLGVSLRLDHQQAVQRVTIAGSPSAGSYTLSYLGVATDAIAYNAPEADVQAALRLITGLEAVQVSTTGVSPNFRHLVQMHGVSVVPVSLLVAASSLTGGSIAVASVLAASDSAITRALNEVTAFMNKFLKAYLPYTANGAMLADNWDINRIATDLAICRISMYLGNPVPQSFKARCDAALLELKDYLAGIIEVPGITMSSPVGALKNFNMFFNEGNRVVINPNNIDDVFRAMIAQYEGKTINVLDPTLNYSTNP